MEITAHTEVILVWAVFFMFKLLKTVLVGALILGAFRLGTAVRDSQVLYDEIIRLHVVGASDSEEDQAVKLQVRDAVIELLNNTMAEVDSKVDAKAFLQDHLDEIVDAANAVLEQAGFAERVTVTLTQEEFDTREYETFSLPAGVYDSLRIVIGQGEGKNWWCVVFPRLCLPKESFEAEAVGSGFSDTLTDTLSNNGKYEVRFWVLDQIGKIRNWFHR